MKNMTIVAVMLLLLFLVYFYYRDCLMLSLVLILARYGAVSRLAVKNGDK
jgi:hypothetical protein